MKLADGEERAIRFVATTTYWSSDGKPISAQEFLNRLFGKIAAVIINEDALRTAWIAPDNRESSWAQLLDRPGAAGGDPEGLCRQ